VLCDKQIFEEGITAVSWTQVKGNAKENNNKKRSYVERAKTLLGPLKPLTTGKSSKDKSEASTGAWRTGGGEKEKVEPDVLVVAASQSVALCVYGSFYLATIDLGPKPGSQIFDVHLTNDMAQLVAMVKHSTGGSDRLEMVSFDTKALSTQQEQIGDVVSQLQQIHALLAYLDAATKAMQSQWSANMKEVNAKLSQLGTLLTANASSSSPREELLSMLVCGIISAPLSQFIAEKLGPAGITALDKRMDQTCSSVLALINDHLSPATEQIIFRLGELEGLARWRVRYQGIGLVPEALAALTDLATRMRAQAEHALLLLCKVRANYASFFRWLGRMCTLLSEGAGGIGTSTATSQDLDQLADFLHRDLPDDRFGSLLESPAIGIGIDSPPSIARALGALRAEVETFGKVPGAALQRHFHLASRAPLCDIPSGSDLPQCTLRSWAPNGPSALPRCQAALVYQGLVYVVKAPQGGSLAIAQMPCEEGEPLAADFYLDESVSILAKSNAGAVASVVSFEELEFQEVPVVEDLCAIEMYSAGGAGETEAVGKAFTLPSGQFTKLVALGSKQLCCAYAPPKRLVVFEPEPEEEEEEEEGGGGVDGKERGGGLFAPGCSGRGGEPAPLPRAG